MYSEHYYNISIILVYRIHNMHALFVVPNVVSWSKYVFLSLLKLMAIRGRRERYLVT